ncbi:MAG: sigma-70 family RNA polymerase sigma factor [Planctomycetes bacterium]|nr:sigma-70 family RNA polymerase sigma factor [Planctomycetota bacterium]
MSGSLPPVSLTDGSTPSVAPDTGDPAPGRQAAGRAAFDRLVQEHWDPVMRYFWKRVSPSEAEDLTQDVFVGAYRAVGTGTAPKMSDPRHWRHYLLSSARNRLTDHWRRRAVRAPIEGMIELTEHERSGARMPAAPNGPIPAEACLMAPELNRGIQDCLGTLDAVARFACWLLYVECTPKREIARLLGRPEASIRLLLGEALAALRRCLEGKGLAPG